MKSNNKLTTRQWIGVACMWLSGLMVGIGLTSGRKTA